MLFRSVSLLLVVATLALMWVCARRLPLSLTAWSAVTLLSALTAPGLSSYARYTSAAVPLLIAAAIAAKSRRAWALMLALSVLALAYLTYASFAGRYVP